jgi:leader peptidase (prepilin peptidase)/N-methyltransferase
MSPPGKRARVRIFANNASGLPTSAAWTTLVLAMVGAAGVLISMASAPGTIGVLGAGLALVTMAIAIIDLRNFVIPDWLNATGFGLAMIHAAAQEPEAVLQAVAWAATRGAALMLVFLALRNLYARIRGRQGLGLGDVKLAGVAGAWLEWPMMPIAVELAAFAALSVYVLRRVLRDKALSATHRVPFGLFFAPAIWVSWLLEMTVMPV